MTLFEYIAIAYSLVLSFAALRIVEGLPHALGGARRWWVHVVFVFVGLSSILMSSGPSGRRGKSAGTCLAFRDSPLRLAQAAIGVVVLVGLVGRGERSLEVAALGYLVVFALLFLLFSRPAPLVAFGFGQSAP